MVSMTILQSLIVVLIGVITKIMILPGCKTLKHLLTLEIKPGPALIV
jgi:hypothetical protein